MIYTGETLKIDITRNLENIKNDVYETGHIIYTIRRGNTLTYIAQKYGVSVESLVRLNNIKNPNLIFTGERLRINR